jgi:hypothetical protein
VSTVFNFFATDDDAEFSLVDNKPAPRQRFGGRGRFNPQRFQRRDQTQFVGTRSPTRLKLNATTPYTLNPATLIPMPRNLEPPKKQFPEP